MGFVRKRPSRTRGTRYQAVAVLDGSRVQLGTFDSVALATDAWQHAETAARRGGRAGDRSTVTGCPCVTSRPHEPGGVATAAGTTTVVRRSGTTPRRRRVACEPSAGAMPQLFVAGRGHHVAVAVEMKVAMRW